MFQFDRFEPRAPDGIYPCPERQLHPPHKVSGLLGEKDETIRQLELKLRTACNQRERAEARCGEALEENAKMRSDLAMLAAQVILQISCHVSNSST